MYAVVVQVSIDPARLDEARANLDSQVVPMVKQSPGAVAGYWLDADDQNRGLSVVIFENKEQADTALAMVPEEPGPGVRVQSKEVREVAAGF